MSKIAPFEAHSDRYEQWFEKHRAAYLSELLALRPFVPWTGDGLEIGVGSGRFAAPLGVRTGVDPSPTMRALARVRGIDAVDGIAEALPFPDGRFDHVLVVTTLCFVDSPAAMLAEARRVLRPGGRLAVGFIDRGSESGRAYLAARDDNLFYRDATLFSADDVAQLLQNADFFLDAWGQTISCQPSEIHEIEPLRPGYGEGAFVVAAAARGG